MDNLCLFFLCLKKKVSLLVVKFSSRVRVTVDMTELSLPVLVIKSKS